MSDEPFTYEGHVRLLCQEGGFAAPIIELSGIPDDEPPPDITHKALAMLGAHESALSLDRALERFIDGESDRFGDLSLGRLRITVERLSD